MLIEYWYVIRYLRIHGNRLLSAGISNSARGQKYGSHYIRYHDIRLRTGYQDAQPLRNLQTQMPSAAGLGAGDEAVGEANALRV